MIPYATKAHLRAYTGLAAADLPQDADRLLLRASELLRSYTLNREHRGERTAPIAFGASALDVQAALEALEDIDPGDVTVTGAAGGPWTVTFGRSYDRRDVPELVGDESGLVGGTDAAVLVETLQEGEPRFEQDEVQRVSITGDPTGGTFTLQFGLHTAALKDAACAQIEWWFAVDESADIEGPVQGVTLGRLQIQYGAGPNRVAPMRLAPRAADILLQVGLLYRGVAAV